MLFLRVHCALVASHAHRPAPDLHSLASLVANFASRTLNWCIRLVAWPVRRPRPRPLDAKRGPRLPPDLVPSLLLDWSPSVTAIDPLEAYFERSRFYRACALVDRTWTPLACSLLVRDVVVRDPTHPVLRLDCPIDPARVKRITFAPKPRYYGSYYGMTASLRLFLPLCDALTSLALVHADTLELADLGRAPNLVELHLSHVRIGPHALPPARPFKLLRLETLTLDEVGFTMYRPSYAALLDPAALPSLLTLTLHHCDLAWALFPKPRTFLLVTTFRFTHPGAFPVPHLSQLRLPALQHLTLCPVSLGDILQRRSSDPEEADAALALVATARSLRILDAADSRAPPARTTPPLPRLTPTQGLVLPPSATGARALLSVPLPLPARLAAAGAQPHTLVLSLSWTWAPPHAGRLLAHAVAAHATLADHLADALLAGALLPPAPADADVCADKTRDDRTLELPFAMQHGLPPGGDASALRAWRRARARLDRVCRERGVALRFAEAQREEVERARADWGGWAGCVERI